MQHVDLQPDEVVLPTAVATRPSRVRHVVLGFAVTMALLLYLDRMAINVAVETIAKDLGLLVSQVGDSVAAFFWCYALMQIPAGWLGDRWGGRKALTLYVVTWSASIAGVALAAGPLSLVVMRGLLGISQAGAYATTASLLRRWIPFARRGLANSAVSLGGRAGNVLAPFVTSVLMAAIATETGAGESWRWVFVIYGAIGLVWAVLFWRSFRDRPRQQHHCNDAEVALIEKDDPALAADDHAAPVGRLPLRALVTSRDLYALGWINFFINLGWIIVGAWLPTYLIRAHHWTLVDAGTAASLTAAAGMAGCLCGGWTTDYLAHRFGIRWGRRLPCIVSYLAAAVCYATASSLNDGQAILAVLVVASFCGDFGLGAMWATFQDLGGPFSGTVLGAANMCGNIGAAVAISIVGRWLEMQSWSLIFSSSAKCYAIAAAAWLLVDPLNALRPRRVSSD